MNESGVRPKNRHSRAEDADGSEEERRNADSPDQNLDNDSDQPDLNEQIDQNQKSASSDGSKRVSPVLIEEREHKKTNPSGYKATRRYPNRDLLLNRHRDLSQDNKRMLGVQSNAARNSSLAPLLRDGGSLGGILADIPDYYTDGGDTLFTEVTVQFLNAQVRSLKEELENLIRECVDKDEMVILLEQRLKDSEIERTKLQRETTNKDTQIEKLQKQLHDAKEKCDSVKKELSFINREADILKQGQRQAANVKSNLESKLNRALEESERLKTDARQFKQANKEASDHYQRKLEELLEKMRRLEKQNAELHEAIKKQMRLILNLKRQKLHVEAAAAVQFVEEEFMKALDRGT